MLLIEPIAIAIAIASEYKCTKVTSYTRDLLKRLSFTFLSSQSDNDCRDVYAYLNYVYKFMTEDFKLLTFHMNLTYMQICNKKN